MSEEQLAAFWEAVQADAGLQEKVKGASDLDAVLAIAKEAGFDVSKAAWLEFQENQPHELSDEDLENATGGTGMRNGLMYGLSRAWQPCPGGGVPGGTGGKAMSFSSC